MMYYVAKGTNKTVEFKGLSEQYLYMFAGGIVAGIFLFFILNFIGIPSFANFVFVGGGLSAFLYYVYKTNKKYGRYGVMQQQARRAIARLKTLGILATKTYKFNNRPVLHLRLLEDNLCKLIKNKCAISTSVVEPKEQKDPTNGTN